MANMNCWEGRKEERKEGREEEREEGRKVGRKKLHLWVALDSYEMGSFLLGYS